MAVQYNVLNWNARGIRPNKNELEVFIKNNKIDIAIITETKLAVGIKFALRGFCVYRCDGAGGNGGVIVAIRKDIKHARISAGVGGTETVTLEVGGGLRITGIYVHPHDPLPTASLENILGGSPRHLVAGDLNAIHPSWSRGQVNVRGRELSRLADRGGYIILHPDGPTTIPSGLGQGCTIDIIINKNVHLVRRVVTHPELSSDHLPVTFRVGGGLLAGERARELPDYSKANWNLFRTEIQGGYTVRGRIRNTEELEAACADFEEAIRAAAALAVPTVRVGSHPGQTVTPEIQDLIKHKNRVRKKYQRYRNPDDKMEVDRLVREVRYELQESRKENWNFSVTRACENGNPWKLCRRLVGAREQIRWLEQPGGGVVFEGGAVAEALADAFERYHAPG